MVIWGGGKTKTYVSKDIKYSHKAKCIDKFNRWKLPPFSQLSEKNLYVFQIFSPGCLPYTFSRKDASGWLMKPLFIIHQCRILIDSIKIGSPHLWSLSLIALTIYLKLTLIQSMVNNSNVRIVLGRFNWQLAHCTALISNGTGTNFHNQGLTKEGLTYT